MSVEENWGEVSELLHDARLRHVEWDRPLARLSLVFSCLRREADGSAPPDPCVEFRLGGVCTIAIGYESSQNGVRPSQYRLQRRVTAEDLGNWPFPPQEVYVSVNSPECEDDATHAPRSEWLEGDPRSLAASRFRVGLTFSYTRILGMPTNTVVLLVGCDDIQVSSAGVPLGLDTWREQFGAWWEHWRKHWEAKGGDAVEGEGPCLEDLFIPAGESPPPDLTYRPPREPVVAWEPTGAPAELLGPITALFEARHREDSRAHEEGAWWYARQVDGWWVEGANAEVAVRGIEHTAPLDESPAENVETVWVFRLRQRSGGWAVRTWSQGWPPCRSASTNPSGEKLWLRNWSSGPIRSAPTDTGPQ